MLRTGILIFLFIFRSVLGPQMPVVILQENVVRILSPFDLGCPGFLQMFGAPTNLKAE